MTVTLSPLDHHALHGARRALRGEDASGEVQRDSRPRRPPSACGRRASAGGAKIRERAHRRRFAMGSFRRRAPRAAGREGSWTASADPRRRRKSLTQSELSGRPSFGMPFPSRARRVEAERRWSCGHFFRSRSGSLTQSRSWSSPSSSRYQSRRRAPSAQRPPCRALHRLAAAHEVRRRDDVAPPVAAVLAPAAAPAGVELVHRASGSQRRSGSTSLADGGSPGRSSLSRASTPPSSVARFSTTTSWRVIASAGGSGIGSLRSASPRAARALARSPLLLVLRAQPPLLGPRHVLAVARAHRRLHRARLVLVPAHEPRARAAGTRAPSSRARPRAAARASVSACARATVTRRRAASWRSAVSWSSVTRIISIACRRSATVRSA